MHVCFCSGLCLTTTKRRTAVSPAKVSVSNMAIFFTWPMPAMTSGGRRDDWMLWVRRKGEVSSPVREGKYINLTLVKVNCCWCSILYWNPMQMISVKLDFRKIQCIYLVFLGSLTSVLQSPILPENLPRKLTWTLYRQVEMPARAWWSVWAGKRKAYFGWWFQTILSVCRTLFTNFLARATILDRMK